MDADVSRDKMSVPISRSMSQTETVFSAALNKSTVWRFCSQPSSLFQAFCYSSIWLENTSMV